MSDLKMPRRILPRSLVQPQEATRVTDVTIVLAPTINTLTSDALSIIQTEITRYKHKSNAGKLDQADHRIIQGYLKALGELDRVNRAREEDMDLANASDEELLKLVEGLKAKKEPQK